jgi:hypothetical protein
MTKTITVQTGETVPKKAKKKVRIGMFDTDIDDPR